MKKSILLCAALMLCTSVVPVFAQKTKAPKNPRLVTSQTAPAAAAFTIKAHCDDLPEGTRVQLYVFEYVDGMTAWAPILDSAVVDANHEFMLKGSVEGPMYAGIRQGRTRYINFFLENAEYTLAGTSGQQPVITGGSGLTEKEAEYTALQNKYYGTPDVLLEQTKAFIRANAGNAVGAYILGQWASRLPFGELEELLALFPESDSYPTLKVLRAPVTAQHAALDRPVASACPDGGFVVNGQFLGQQGEDKVYVLKQIGFRKYEFADSTIVARDGRFEFTGKVDYPTRYVFVLGSPGEGSKGQVNVFVENSIISFTSFKPMATNEHYSVELVSGSHSNDQSLVSPVVYGFGSGRSQYDALAARIAQDTKSMPVLLFLAENCNAYSPMSTAQMRELAGMFDPSVHNTVYWKIADENIATTERTPRIGDQFRDFSMADVNGKTIALSEVAGKDKYVLLDFWASWCGPCRAEGPALKAAYAKYKDKGFEIFGVSVDSDGEAWRQAIADDGYTWINVSELKGRARTESELYGVQGIPANFLIGPDGAILAKNLRGNQVAAKLAEIFGE